MAVDEQEQQGEGRARYVAYDKLYVSTVHST